MCWKTPSSSREKEALISKTIFKKKKLFFNIHVLNPVNLVDVDEVHLNYKEVLCKWVKKKICHVDRGNGIQRAVCYNIGKCLESHCWNKRTYLT